MDEKLITLQKEKDLLVERVALQHAGLPLRYRTRSRKQSQIVQQKITNELNERKRPAEDASPIITPPPNLRSPHKTEDNSFDYYNEETEDAQLSLLRLL
ncbi:unnamed protein product [Rhizophagus irregularis]|nr:unnamed protein product [Rhizophagus irregularis]